MNMIRSVAIDDEPLALQVLQQHADKINFLALEKTFTSPSAGMQYIKENKIPVVFLDIKMQDVSGLELAEMLPQGTKIIFTTAYENYAVKGFELDAIDYLLKPVSFSRFLKACLKIKNHEDTLTGKTMIMVKDGTEIVRLKLADIFFIEATGNYLKLHTAGGTCLHRQTMKEFEEALPAGIFVRCHKSFIVNMHHIHRIENYQLTIDNRKIPLSPNYKEEVWNKLGIKK